MIQPLTTTDSEGSMTFGQPPLHLDPAGRMNFQTVLRFPTSQDLPS